MRNGVLDPRQSQAIVNYRNPKSETFGNLYRSLLKAGYDDQYANSIHSRDPEWLSQSVKSDVEMVQRAERNLQKYLKLDIALDNKLDVDLAKLQVDVSKFLLKTLAKQKYSEDAEVTPPNVQINIVNYNTKKQDVKDIEPITPTE